MENTKYFESAVKRWGEEFHVLDGIDDTALKIHVALACERTALTLVQLQEISEYDGEYDVTIFPLVRFLMERTFEQEGDYIFVDPMDLIVYLKLWHQHILDSYAGDGEGREVEAKAIVLLGKNYLKFKYNVILADELKK